MNISHITSKLILLLATAFVLCGCGRSDPCVDADDFGFAKVNISSRYDEGEIFGDKTAEITPWIDHELILDGNPLYIEVKNFDPNPSNNVSGILSAWCPWYGDQDHDSTLTDFCARLNPCVVSSLCPTPPAVSLPITNAPCLMTKGMGLYALLAKNGYDANLSIDTMSNPDREKAVSLHLGNHHTDYRIPSMDNDGNIRDAGGVLYNYDNVSNVSEYYNGTLYFKILDSFYEDNNGKYRVFVKSGVKNGGWDPISWCISLVQTSLFGNSSAENDHAGGGGIIPGIYKAVAANSGFVSAVQALLTLYIIFSAMGFLMGSLELTQKELIDRVFKTIIITTLIGQNSWEFFNEHVFIWFYEGTGFIISILHEVAASGPGSTNPLDFFFSEEVFIKLSSLLFATPTGWIFIIVYIIMLVFLVQIYFDAAVLYMTSLIMIGVLICISPIFIALFLFEQTKSFFDNWLKQIMAYSIQMILVYAGILFMTMIIRNQVYNTLGFPACAIQFPNIGNITIFEWYFPKIQSWSSNPALANIPIPKAHFESAASVAAQAARDKVAEAQSALDQANANKVVVQHIADLETALTNAQNAAIASKQGLTYQQAQAKVVMTAIALQAAEAQVKTDNAALAQAKADQNLVNGIAHDLEVFGIGPTPESADRLNKSIIVAQNIGTQYMSAQLNAASGQVNAALAQVAADEIALKEAQKVLGSNYTQNNVQAQQADIQLARDNIVKAEAKLKADIILSNAAAREYQELSEEAAQYNALTALMTTNKDQNGNNSNDFAALAAAKASGQQSRINAAQAKLVNDAKTQIAFAQTIMNNAVSSAKDKLSADIRIAQNANADAQAAADAQVAAAASQAGTAQDQATLVQAQTKKIADAQAALRDAEAKIIISYDSTAEMQAEAAKGVADAQDALNEAQAKQALVSQYGDAAASASLGGFEFSSSTTPSAQNNTFCRPYECTGERYPDLPFLDPHDPYESRLINQMRNGQIGDFGGIAIIVVCVYLMDHFNKTTVSMSKFLSDTQMNMGDSSQAAATAATGLQSMAKSQASAAYNVLSKIASGIKSKRGGVKGIDDKSNGSNKPLSDHENDAIRADAVKGGLSSVHEEALKLSEMSHADATAFNRNLKNSNYHNELEHSLKTPTSAGGIGMAHGAEAHLASGRILQKLSASKAGDFKNIAASELFAKDSRYAHLKGAVDYSKLSAADAAKVDKLSDRLKVMLNDKSRQDKFADAYVRTYAKMSNEGVGLLKQRSSVARGMEGAPKGARDVFDNHKWDETSLRRGGAEHLSKDGHTERTGTLNARGLANVEHFAKQLEKCEVNGKKLTSHDQHQIYSALKKQGFTDKQIDSMQLVSITQHTPGRVEQLSGKNAVVRGGKEVAGVITHHDAGQKLTMSSHVERTGTPNMQGVSHAGPFSQQLDRFVGMSGKKLTSHDKTQIYSALKTQGFSDKQIDSMQLVSITQHTPGSVEQLSGKNTVVRGGKEVAGVGTHLDAEHKPTMNPYVERTGTPNMQGVSHAGPFGQQLERFVGMGGKKLTSHDKTQIYSALKTQGFSDKQIDSMQLVSITQHEPGVEQLSSKNAVVCGGKEIAGIITNLDLEQKPIMSSHIERTGTPNMQGVSHEGPFGQQLERFVGMNGKKLTPRDKAQIYSELQKQGFTDKQIDSMQLVSITQHMPGRVEQLATSPRSRTGTVGEQQGIPFSRKHLEGAVVEPLSVESRAQQGGRADADHTATDSHVERTGTVGEQQDIPHLDPKQTLPHSTQESADTGALSQNLKEVLDHPTSKQLEPVDKVASTIENETNPSPTIAEAHDALSENAVVEHSDEKEAGAPVVQAGQKEIGKTPKQLGAKDKYALKLAMLTGVESEAQLGASSEIDMKEIAKVRGATVDRSGPGGQGASHSSEPFKQHLDTVGEAGTKLTSHKKEQKDSVPHTDAQTDTTDRVKHVNKDQREERLSQDTQSVGTKEQIKVEQTEEPAGREAHVEIEHDKQTPPHSMQESADTGALSQNLKEVLDHPTSKQLEPVDKVASTIENEPNPSPIAEEHVAAQQSTKSEINTREVTDHDITSIAEAHDALSENAVVERPDAKETGAAVVQGGKNEIGKAQLAKDKYAHKLAKLIEIEGGAELGASSEIDMKEIAKVRGATVDRSGPGGQGASHSSEPFKQHLDTVGEAGTKLTSHKKEQKDSVPHTDAQTDTTDRVKHVNKDQHEEHLSQDTQSVGTKEQVKIEHDTQAPQDVSRADRAEHQVAQQAGHSDTESLDKGKHDKQESKDVSSPEHIVSTEGRLKGEDSHQLPQDESRADATENMRDQTKPQESKDVQRAEHGDGIEERAKVEDGHQLPQDELKTETTENVYGRTQSQEHQNEHEAEHGSATELYVKGEDSYQMPQDESRADATENMRDQTKHLDQDTQIVEHNLDIAEHTEQQSHQTHDKSIEQDSTTHPMQAVEDARSTDVSEAHTTTVEHPVEEVRSTDVSTDQVITGIKAKNLVVVEVEMNPLDTQNLVSIDLGSANLIDVTREEVVEEVKPSKYERVEKKENPKSPKKHEKPTSSVSGRKSSGDDVPKGDSD